MGIGRGRDADSIATSLATPVRDAQGDPNARRLAMRSVRESNTHGETGDARRRLGEQEHYG